ncbi:tRNA(Ile2) C34 agmatinyltransferase TiaS [Candidatus Methanomarinus sp.]|nr:tRNA(Ile2) C34 agmatinyltransferase TiaS [ANME-2 cluster archaeon]
MVYTRTITGALKMKLDEPYTVTYDGIYAVCDRTNRYVDIIERSTCYGGSAWTMHHYASSPLISDIRSAGNMIRYCCAVGTKELELEASVAAAGIESVKVTADEVEITYAGLGGGGVGATVCRAQSQGVLGYNISESGGGRAAKGTITVPRLERLLIGIDDTDNKEQGATWSLAHNIAANLDHPDTRYISHALVQLFPAPAKTQNCVSTVLEFGCADRSSKQVLLEGIYSALEKYSVSNETGMVVLDDFDASHLKDYSHECRTKILTKQYALETARSNNVEIMMSGNGIIGAIAALPWYARPNESVKIE